MNKLLLIIAMIPLFLMGCITGQTVWTPEQREQIASRVFNYNYDKVFNAVVNRWENVGFSIAKADKESGIIETATRTNGNAIGSASLNAYARVIKIDDKSTKVKLALHMNAKVEFGAISSDPITYGDEAIGQKDYEQAFNGITEELTKENK